MILALSTGLSWTLVFGIFAVIATGVVYFHHKANERGKREARAIRLEWESRLGPPMIESLVEHQRRKADRAEFRFATRWSRREP